MIFGEIITLAELLLQTGYEQTLKRRKSGWLEEDKRMCETAYQFYAALNEVHEAISVLLYHYFVIPMDSDSLQGTTSFETPEKKWEYFTNKDFERIDLHIFKLIELAKLHYDSFTETGLNSYLHCKSFWADEFKRTYQSGRVMDGNLYHAHLPFAIPADIDSEKRQYTRAYSKEPVTYALDISTYEKRITIAKEVKQSLTKLDQKIHELKVFILRHCTLETLLQKGHRLREKWIDELVGDEE